MAALVACLAQLQHRVDRNVVLRQWNAPPGAGGWGGGGGVEGAQGVGVEGVLKEGFRRAHFFPSKCRAVGEVILVLGGCETCTGYEALTRRKSKNRRGGGWVSRCPRPEGGE